MRLIDADALIEELNGKYIVPVDETTRGIVAFMGIQTRQAIYNAPTIEAEPRKHGKWEQYKTETVYDDIMGGEHQFKRFRCSLCGYDVGGNNKFHYCPNCGADMRGSIDE